MVLPSPKRASDYPYYIVGYWFLIWGVLFLYSVVSFMFSATPDGKYVEKRDCIESAPAGRYDEQEECIEWSEPYYISFGEAVKDSFRMKGIIVGLAALTIGGYAMYNKHKEEGINPF